MRNAWILIPLFTLLGCQKNPSLPDPQELQIQLAGEPAVLDPTLAEEGLSFRILINVMDGLMGYDGQGKLVQRLAESYEVSKDRKTYSFQLKPHLKWSDGMAISGDQFKVAIERAKKPENGSKLSGFLKIIDRVETGEKSVKFFLNRPSGSFLHVLTLPITYPLRQDVLAANQGKWDLLRGKKIPTNGFYRIEAYEADQKLVLLSNHPDSPSPKKVTLRFITDESTGVGLFEQGKLDVLSRIPAYDHKKYEKNPSYRVVPFLATYFLGFNIEKPPFSKRELRKAVAGAIKKSEIVRALGSGEIPASSWIPKGLAGYEEYRENSQGLDPRFSDDVKRSRNPVHTSSPGLEVTMGFDTSGRNSLVMEKVQSDLKQNLGWNVVLNNTDWKTYIQGLYRDPAPIFRFGWFTPMMDAAIFLSPFRSGDPLSFTRYSNPRLDQLIDEIGSMALGPEREAKTKAAQKIILEEETLIVPIYHYVSSQVLGPRVEEYPINPFGYTLFEEVRMKHFIREQ